MADKTPKMVKMRNTKKRNYRGTSYMQIVDIAEHNVAEYEQAGFVVYDANATTTAPQDDGQLEITAELVKDAKAYLKDNDIRFAKNSKDETIVEKAIKNGFDPQGAQGPEINDNIDPLAEDDGAEIDDPLAE